MKQIDIHDAETDLSRCIAGLEPGEVISFCDQDQPVAELRAVSKPKRGIPRIGVAKGEFEVTDAFFEPLPDEILDAFNCK